jgi:hypothetical protein
MCEVKGHALGFFGGGMLSLIPWDEPWGMWHAYINLFEVICLNASWKVQLSCFQMFNVPLDGIVNPHIFGGQNMKVISNNCIFSKSKLKHIW